MKEPKTKIRFKLNGSAAQMVFMGLVLSGILWGCAVTPKKLIIQGNPNAFGAGTIISAETGRPLSFEALMNELINVRVIYVGENHIDPAHHQIQLKVIRALAEKQPDMAVGMEMFDRSYQSVLDLWPGGILEEGEFVKKTHWYANWRHPYELYSDILDFIKIKKLRLVALNLPFHIPPKIRIGGVDNLLECDSAYLPKHIDTTSAAHRTYVEEAFKQHHGRVKDNFEYFYLAQCIWEDVMAESIAEHLQGDRMVVLAGNGHIIRKFGIPDRAYKRSGAPFRTIYLAPAGSTVTPDVADYLWVTP